jgi:cell division protein ZapA (FtsZ GTPase activity inhibitor)
MLYISANAKKIKKMEKDLEKENSHLRAALALAVGSLESVRYLINSTDCDPDQRDHIKSITERVLKDIQELVD